MFTLISSIIVAIGIANWFSIGAFQYDFVAGLFGSQANIFSRLVYVIVGIAGVFLAYSIIRNKGKLVFKNKNDKALFSFGKKAKVNAESGTDNSLNNENNDVKTEAKDLKQNKNMESAYDTNLKQETKNHTAEASFDTSVNSANSSIQQRASRINDKNKLSAKDFNTESAKESGTRYRTHSNNKEN